MKFFSNIAAWAGREPARAYLAVRAILAILAGSGLAFFTPEFGEQIALLVAILLGVDTATTEATRKKTYGPESAQNLASLVTPEPLSEVGAYVVDLVKGMVPASLVPAALSQVAPIITEFANRSLTDDLRQGIQIKVHSALRKAGILRGRNLGSVSILALLTLGILLTACTPASRLATGGLNELTGDEAALAWLQDEPGVAFHPGDAPALAVIVDIQGEMLQLVEELEECGVNDERTLLVCTYPEVTELVAIGLTGQDVTASASYRRQPGGRFYSTYLTN